MDLSNAKLTMDDIVFEGRNQAYGAFYLRKVYDNIILRAFVISFLAFFLALVGPLIAEALKPEEVVEEVAEIKIDPKLLPPPPIDPKTPPPPPVKITAPPPPPVSTVKFIPPTIVPDEEVKDEDPPKQEDLSDKVTAAKTIEGDPNADPNQIVVDNPGDGQPGGVGVAPAEEEVFMIVEQQPTFPGGDGELFKFVNKHIKYPYQAQKAEVSGTVYVEFIVNSDGHLSDFRVLKGQGFGLDEEALRVIKMSPDWVPGKNNGKSVRVRVQVPIKFRLQQG